MAVVNRFYLLLLIVASFFVLLLFSGAPTLIVNAISPLTEPIEVLYSDANGNIQKDLSIRYYLQNTLALGYQYGTNPDGNFLLDVNGNVRIRGDANIQTYYGTNASSISAGAGAGSTPTISISGSQVFGQVNVTTGVLPSVASTVVTIAFTNPCKNDSYAEISPANANTALLSGVTNAFADGNAMAWTITSGSSALTGATAYSWNYDVGCS